MGPVLILHLEHSSHVTLTEVPNSLCLEFLTGCSCISCRLLCWWKRQKLKADKTEAMRRLKGSTARGRSSTRPGRRQGQRDDSSSAPGPQLTQPHRPSEDEQRIKNKTNPKVPCGSKGHDLAIIHTIWEQTQLCHSHDSYENGETNKKRE